MRPPAFYNKIYVLIKKMRPEKWKMLAVAEVSSKKLFFIKNVAVNILANKGD